MNTLTLREGTVDDYAVIAELRNYSLTDPVSVSSMLDADRRRSPEAFNRNIVVERDGEVVGYGRVTRQPSNEEGSYYCCIDVRPDRFREGIGSSLLAQITKMVLDKGGHTLRCAVRDDREHGLSFVDKHGFVQEQYLFESGANLCEFEPDRFSELMQRVESAGIRLFSFDSMPQTEETRRKIHAVHNESDRDTPGFATWGEPSFEDFERMIFDALWFVPEGLWLAADGDELVGLAMLGVSPSGDYLNEYTGVLPSHRGKGIATALKIKTMELAKSKGVRFITTRNDDRNKAMLAVNEKLGYERMLGWKYMKRRIAE